MEDNKKDDEVKPWSEEDLKPEIWNSLSAERQAQIRAAMHSDVLAGR